MLKVVNPQVRKTYLSVAIAAAIVAGPAHTQEKTPVPEGDTYFSGEREVPIWFADDAIAILEVPTVTGSESEVLAIAQQIVPTSGTVLQTGDAGVVVELQEGQNAAELLGTADTTTRASSRLAAVYRTSPGSNSALLILGGELIVFGAPGISRNELDGIVASEGGGTFLEPLLDGQAYLYSCSSDASCLAAANALQKMTEIEYAYPNWIQVRETRQRVQSGGTGTRFTPTDPLFIDQWHLTNTGQGGGTPGEDANIQGASASGYLPVIAIVDDGLELSHEDIDDSFFVSNLGGTHIDIRDGDSDPSPGPGDFHGTAVAGVAGAPGFNGVGVSGVDPSASLAGIRLVGGGQTDAMEAQALTHLVSDPNAFPDIYNNSWGPADNGALHSVGPLVETALETGVLTGRPGFGTAGAIYVWAGGNGGTGDNSNYDAYANSRYTIAVGASTNTGVQASYSEDGANLLVNAPSNGGSLGITTTDLTGASGYDPSNYTSTFGGTSSASPVVAGVSGLMFDANFNLTWRDVQKVLALSAERNDSGDADWMQNGAGHWVNHKYGFGRVDATAAENLAATWTNLGPEIVVTETNNQTIPIPQPENGGGSAIVNLSVTDQIFIQHVALTIDSDHTFWGDLNIVLTSPDGTQSVLTETHNVGGSGAQLTGGFTFTSMRHLDELSVGNWTLEVTDNLNADTGDINAVTLELFGVEPMCNGLAIDVDFNQGETTGPGPDVVLGTSGNDDIRGKGGNDTICGLGGNDFIHGNSGNDWIDGGAGIDFLRGGQGDDTIYAGTGATVGHPSRVFAGTGNDMVFGGPDADDLRGGRGNDTMFGGGGDDELRGNDDDDSLFGDEGDDLLLGGQGDDDMGGDADTDVCDGGSGTGDTADSTCETVANVP